ncbi:Uncharacterised protein [Vibrio cholerae]|nr:Uncharacterised protein [Vibrio cholerae]
MDLNGEGFFRRQNFKQIREFAELPRGIFTQNQVWILRNKVGKLNDFAVNGYTGAAIRMSAHP